ncbi:diguanylate cyclase [Comamonas testosteroni]|uniref:Diguanylate cyclase n=1 Tax=Comamonas testosteroni TaxID=285 RepID=A0A0L7N7S5_COMTE|nr:MULTISPECIES: sensor domain-containing diguanylate cyclase [Comamonas]KOC30277.1 diguanylate cyclase [Comamonas testosteroni]MDN5505292.1 sensor domain-containing diguanylate cyclase [Comamonas sp.]MDN5536806.1 sensor domain-containing diguanylate cyclase [Comamonas sp.]
MPSIIQRLSQTVSASQNLPSFTRPLLEIMVEVTDLESAYLTTVDEARGIQNVLYSLNTGGMKIPEGLEVPWHDTLCKRSLDEGRTFTDNVGECWGDSDAARQLGIQTYVSTPVRFSNGALFGTLCAASDHSVALAAEAEDLLRLFAKIIAGFAEREQLVRSLQHANEELASLAMLDSLTGLPNRRCVTEELNRLIAHCRRTREWVLVGFVDLDRFKQINDQFGHEAGDALLRAMAEQLRAGLRSSDMLARFGGDEFVMVGAGPLLDEDAEAVIREMQLRLSKASVASLQLSDGREIEYPGASVGMVCLMPDDTDVDDALQKADAAMYKVKAARQRLPEAI